MPMENPFPTGRPVTGEELCGRVSELERLQSAAAAGRPALAAGRSGAGLTSTARTLIGRLAPAGGPAVLVDAGGRAAAEAVARDALAALGGGGADGAGAATGGSREEGDPAPDGGEDGEDPAALLASRLSATGGAAAGHLVVDGVDGREGLEGLADLVATVGGEGVGVGVFLRGPADGAASGLAEELRARELDPEGPAALGPVPLAAWMPHVLERFLRTDRWIGNDHVRWAVDFTGGHPRHAARLFALLWEEAGPGGEVDEAALERAGGRLLREAGSRFRLQLDPLTANQRRLLEALARAEPPVRPFASDFVRGHGFASPSSVQRALDSLGAEGLVAEEEEEEEAGPRVADPLLARWLRRPRAERVRGEGA